VATPKRCVTLHSERLTNAAWIDGGAPGAVLDGPTAVASPDTTPDFGLGGGDSGFDGGGGGGSGGGGGGAAFPNPPTGGVGGGGGAPGSGPISSAPEPETWMLMILGVGLCGGALRRARRTAAAVSVR